MSEPIFSTATENFYNRLPSVYRFEDARRDWVFKRWLSGVLDSQGEIETLISRFKYVPPEDGPDVQDLHSDLVDPTTADAAWLPWLAQLVGVNYDYILDEPSRRTAIANAIGGVQAGTKAAIIQAAQTVLTGSKTVYVYPFSNNVGGIGAGTQWEVLVMTIAAETASDPVTAIINLGAKPAGVKLYHVTYGADWDTIESTFPTWDDWDSTTWADMEQA